MDKEITGLSVYRYFKTSLLGAGGGALVVTMVLAASAALMTSGALPSSSAEAVAVIAVVLGAGAAGLISAVISGENGMFCGAVAGTVMFLLVWAAGGAIGVGDFGPEALFRLAETVIPAAIGGVAGVNMRRSAKI